MSSEEFRDSKQPHSFTTSPDHFKYTHNMTFAGTQLLIDIWQAQGLDEMERVETALKESINSSRATLINIHLHRFTPSGGISGIAILAESHISVHTWPERKYAAVDIFMCGDTHPELAIPVLCKTFLTSQIDVKTIQRGQIR
ncbi:MAG: adenosylmethionine decarboxylase [Pseudomonadota bacterium]|nr:adenosylmethionine decarboxylase [Pseudomonadota bacterium]